MEPTKLSKLNDFFKSYISSVSGHDKVKTRKLTFKVGKICPIQHKIHHPISLQNFREVRFLGKIR